MVCLFHVGHWQCRMPKLPADHFWQGIRFCKSRLVIKHMLPIPTFQANLDVPLRAGETCATNCSDVFQFGNIYPSYAWHLTSMHGIPLQLYIKMHSVLEWFFVIQVYHWFCSCARGYYTLPKIVKSKMFLSYGSVCTCFSGRIPWLPISQIRMYISAGLPHAIFSPKIW